MSATEQATDSAAPDRAAESTPEQAVQAVKSATPAKAFVKQQVMMIKQMGFNHLEDAVIEAALADNDNNIDATLDDLLAANFVIEPGQEGEVKRKPKAKKDEKDKEFWEYQNSGLGVYNLSTPAGKSSAYEVKGPSAPGAKASASAQAAADRDTFAPIITGTGATV